MVASVASAYRGGEVASVVGEERYPDHVLVAGDAQDQLPVRVLVVKEYWGYPRAWGEPIGGAWPTTAFEGEKE